MYSRPYIDDSERVPLPLNYDGTTFGGEENAEKNCTRPHTNEEKPTFEGKSTTASANADIGLNQPFGGLLGFGKKLFGGWPRMPFRLEKLGTEEILIIATALFLLFSKDGDKECAILLLLLLLIN